MEGTTSPFSLNSELTSIQSQKHELSVRVIAYTTILGGEMVYFSKPIPP